MLESALQALATLADPFRFAMLAVGMLAGGALGMLPGMGGVSVVSILLPMIYTLEPSAGLAMLMGAMGVVYTADTITSVLVGTPGSPASAPSAIEGYAMAKAGRAAHALSAAFLSSLFGGLIGALVLTLSIPIAGPLVLAFGTPELFVLTLLGIYYSGSLLGTHPIRGLLSALLGLLLGTVGPAPAATEFRFIFGQPYLMGGLSLVVVALGFFGVTEIVSMLARGGAISRSAAIGGGWRDGARDVLRHRWLVLRGALIGTFAGLLPAVGANASTWVSYGHAVATAPDRSRFGHGEIRGIVASESANNATIGADLVPTLLFSVPGGPAAAVFMGALFVYGLYPGPRFVSENLDLMFVIIWSFAIASVMGAALSFAASPWIARITRVPFALIAPPLLLVIVLGSYQSTQHIGDLILLGLFGLAGWAMKRGGWPRAPLLIGFVLADPMERYFWLTVRLHGWRWLTFPGVLALAALFVLPLAGKIWRLYGLPLATRLWQRLRQAGLGRDAGTWAAMGAPGMPGLPGAPGSPGASRAPGMSGTSRASGAPGMLAEGVSVGASSVGGISGGAGAQAEGGSPTPSKEKAGTVAKSPSGGLQTPGSTISLALSGALLAMFALALWQSVHFFADARLLPLLVTVPGTVLAAVEFGRELRAFLNRRAGTAGQASGGIGQEGEETGESGAEMSEEGGEPGLSREELQRLRRRELGQFGVLAAFITGIGLFGFYVPTVVYTLATLVVKARFRPGWAVVYTAVAMVALDRLAAFMNMRLPSGLLF